MLPNKYLYRNALLQSTKRSQVISQISTASLKEEEVVDDIIRFLDGIKHCIHSAHGWEHLLFILFEAFAPLSVKGVVKID